MDQSRRSSDQVYNRADDAGGSDSKSEKYFSTSITFPWPPKELSPNFRTRSTRWVSRKRKEYRATCAQIAWDRGIRPIDGGSLAQIVFHAPTRNTPDLDNAVARFKAGQDGLAEAMGTDDANFTPDYRFGPPVKGGAVVALIEIPG